MDLGLLMVLSQWLSRGVTRLVSAISGRSERAAAEIAFRIELALLPVGLLTAVGGLALGSHSASLGGVVMVVGLVAVAVGLMCVLLATLAPEVAADAGAGSDSPPDRPFRLGSTRGNTSNATSSNTEYWGVRPGASLGGSTSMYSTLRGNALALTQLPH